MLEEQHEGVLVATGDVVTQQFVEQKGVTHDFARTARMGVVGLIIGPVLRTWYLTLDRLVPGVAKTAGFKKMLLDQALFAPWMICFFFGVTETLAQKRPEIKEMLQERYIETMITNYKIWPLAQADILHVKSGFDVAVFYRAKHGTGKSFYYYGTPGLGEEFLRSNSDFAPTVKDMFEAFSVQYGPPPTKASPQDPQPPSDCPSAEASDLEHQQPSNCPSSQGTHADSPQSTNYPSSQVPASATASPADSPQTNNYPSSQVLAPAIASHPDSPPTLQSTNCSSSQDLLIEVIKL